MNDPLIDELRSVPLWRDYQPTPLIELPEAAQAARVGRVFAKIEADRPLGNFKVLGGVLAGLRALARDTGAGTIDRLMSGRVDRPLPRLLCASDGNHGLAVATAARCAGTAASIYLPASVSPIRSARIRAAGAEVVTVQGTYDDAVEQALAAARSGAGLLIADTTGDPADRVVQDVMDGYGLLSREAGRQFASLGLRPSHLFVQAGVGGLAASMAKEFRPHMSDPARIVVVEPASAACVRAALAAGHPVRIQGDLATSAEMLSCGQASAPAVHTLLQAEAASLLVDDAAMASAVRLLSMCSGRGSTPSGAAGLAGLCAVASDDTWRAAHGLSRESTVLIVISESGAA